MINLTTTPSVIGGQLTPRYISWKYTPSYVINNDFKYVIDINTDDGLLNTFNTVSENTSFYSKLSVNVLLKNVLKNNFQHNILYPATNLKSIIPFKLNITPFDNGDKINNDSVDTDTSFTINATSEDLGYDYFLNNENKKMLVDTDHHFMPTEVYASNKALRGSFGNDNYKLSNWDNIKYFIESINGTSYEYILNYNEYINSYDKDIVLNEDDSKKYLIDIPYGSGNLYNSPYITLNRIILANGFIIYPDGNYSVVLQNGDKYKYAAYLGENRVSKFYNVTIKNCSTRFSPTPVYWLNENGGYEMFVFYAKNEKQLKVNNKHYNKINYENVGNSYLKNDRGGSTVYQQDTQVIHEIISDWLTDEDVKTLESLWSNVDMFIVVEGVTYKVISLTKTAVINNKKSAGLFKYKLDVELSVKKYRI